MEVEFVNCFWLVEMRLLMMENSLVLKIGFMMMNFACFSKLHKLLWTLGVSMH